MSNLSKIRRQEMLDYLHQLKEIHNDDESITQLRDINSSFGHEGLDLGDNTEKRTYLLYKTFDYIVENDLDTGHFGAFYSGFKNFQDMAKAFGNRLIYPFVSGVESYLLDISTDMGFDDTSLYNISINSSGVQVNIAQNNSAIEATQINQLNTDEIKNAISQTEKAINEIYDEESRQVLKEQLRIIQKEAQGENPQKSVLQMALNSMKLIAKSIINAPKLIAGLKAIADIFNLIF